MDSRSEGVSTHPFFIMKKKDNLHIGMLNFTAALIAICLVVYILIIGRSIILPLVVAIVVWYLMVRLASVFSRVPFTQIHIPDLLALIIAFIATGIIIYIFFELIASSINGIIEQAPQYQAAFKKIVATINHLIGSKIQLSKLIENINFTSIFSNLAVTLTNVASSFGLIIVYVLFLLLEYKTFNGKIKAISGGGERLQKSMGIFTQISTDINSYMKIKAAASLLTAGLSFIALYAFGISYAQFWAVLIFLLNFIPTIGSIIAIVITLIAVSIHFTTLGLFISLAGILIAIQFSVGNILEPRLMGKNLNLSPIVILLSLAFWGSIWGIIGMFLCVPLMTILNIVLSKFNNTRFLAVLLAADPKSIKS
jgi:AI-2 transport protein TqsA